jgi:archaeosine synthase beta-subunit
MSYPASRSARERFVLERRGPKQSLEAGRAPDGAIAAFVEEEPDDSGAPVRVATVLLANRECPWRCVFCDLWQSTLDATVPAGAIEMQIRGALAELPGARWIKLYNAGSFFDPKAIPREDFPAIAASVAGFERVIVESHPSLVGAEALRFRDLLRGRLEVAMGLEVADESVLERLNKGMTLAGFADAAERLRRAGIDLRAFVLVQPPFVAPGDAVEQALRALEFARDHGARVVSFVPTRGGNGALEALAAQGEFAPPSLATVEDVFDRSLDGRGARETRGARVFVDLWDLERFSDCPRCFPARRDRLARMNLSQRIEPRVACASHGAGA